LIITSNALNLNPHLISTNTQSLKDYMKTNFRSIVQHKYDIPSLIWPPPGYQSRGLFMTNLMRGLS